MIEPRRVCRQIHLRGSLCDLRAFVVNVFINFTTETQSSTEFAQRNAFIPTDSEGATQIAGNQPEPVCLLSRSRMSW